MVHTSLNWTLNCVILTIVSIQPNSRTNIIIEALHIYLSSKSQLRRATRSFTFTEYTRNGSWGQFYDLSKKNTFEKFLLKTNQIILNFVTKLP